MPDKMLKINLKDVDAMQKFFFGDDVDYELIYSNIYRCIEKGILQDLNKVHFASITFDNGEQIDLECNREEFKENLTNCMSYYEKVEKYERCAMVKKLMDKL